MGSEFCAASAIAVDVGITASAPHKHQLGNVLQMSSVRISLTTKDELWEDKNIAGKFQRQTRWPQSSCANPSCWFTECSLFTNFRRLVLTYSKGPAQEMRLNDLPATRYFEQAQYYDMLWLCCGNLWTRKVLRRKQTWRRGKTEKKKNRKEKKEKKKSCLLRR